MTKTEMLLALAAIGVAFTYVESRGRRRRTGGDGRWRPAYIQLGICVFILFPLVFDFPFIVLPPSLSSRRGMIGLVAFGATVAVYAALLLLDYLYFRLLAPPVDRFWIAVEARMGAMFKRRAKRGSGK
ncbi:MAG TPA: hypothetical protein VG733_11160 [Chthoniobacteraceae bacterium]|nr:hypothetical protein [Chthoniobacteraceae bacterium]